MKYPAFAGLALLTVFALGGCGAGSSVDMESFEGRSSYAVGLDLGTNMQRTGVDLDRDAFMQGFEDGLDENEPMMTVEEIQEVLQQLSRQMQQNQEQQYTEAMERNTTEGQAYLESNAQREGVVTTASGLQYEVLTEATGPKPAATDQVTVHYHGTLVDGTVFDSSVERGEPATFPLNRVIAGWTEGVQLMSVGSKYRFVVPSNLGYGERGSGRIGPNSTLIFEVELLGIEGS